jgi:hypothetical protein
MIKYLIVVCMVAMVVVFQNCSDKQFSARTDLNKSLSLDGSEQLIPEEIADNDNDGGAGSAGGSSTGGSTSGGSTSAGAMNGGSAGSTSAGNHNEDGDDDDEVADYDDEEMDKENDDVTSSEDGKKGKKICMRHGEKMLANEVGICVVEGPGQSNQISLVNDSIVVNNETPRSVCMTAFACRKIVDGKFRVVTLKKTGFCKNGSADSVQLSDQQVKELIDKM